MDSKQHTAILKRKMIQALVDAMGIVTIACKATGIERSTHYNWLKIDQKYKAAIDDIAELPLDYTENKLLKLIDKGDTAATIFYMKTKGKKRGYVERQEVDVNESGSYTIKIEKPA